MQTAVQQAKAIETLPLTAPNIARGHPERRRLSWTITIRATVMGYQLSRDHHGLSRTSEPAWTISLHGLSLFRHWFNRIIRMQSLPVVVDTQRRIVGRGSRFAALFRCPVCSVSILHTITVKIVRIAKLPSEAVSRARTPDLQTRPHLNSTGQWATAGGSVAWLKVCLGSESEAAFLIGHLLCACSLGEYRLR